MPKEIEVKSVLNKTKRRDPWFLDDYTVNMYSSCSFNCLYCYIRGSKYGTNLENSLSIKKNAVQVLEKQLASRARKKQYGIIVLSSATDPYLQIEEKYQLTRRALEVIAKYRFPVHVITKSSGIARDLDLLKIIDETAILPEDLQKRLGRGTIVSFSFSTLSDEVSKVFEPGATRPSVRLETLKQTVKQGFFTGVSLMPLLPFISDTKEHLNLLFSTFKACEVKYVMPATLTLFGHTKPDSRTLVLAAIRKHYPHLLERYERYFRASTEMPDYYRRAFQRKMQELGQEFELPNRILKPS